MAEGAEKEIMNLLTDFLVRNIDEKVLQGISYLILSKTSANEKQIEQLNKMRDRLTELGVGKDEHFRRYDVNTAYIYEIDLNTAVRITEQLSKAVGASQTTDFNISVMANTRRMDDMRRLLNYCVKMAKNGTSQFDVAFFSKNKVSSINLTGVNSNKQPIAVTYEAFALRHTDIVDVNKLLAECRLKISNIIVHEALPSMTGVRVTLNLVAAR